MLLHIIFELIHLTIILIYLFIITKKMNRYKSVRELIKREERMEKALKKVDGLELKSSSAYSIPYLYHGR